MTGAYFAQNVTSVRQVVTSPSSGSEIPGNTITLTVDFSAAVTVTGAPTLTFNDGGTATYIGGSGTSALTFRYTVGASDSFGFGACHHLGQSARPARPSRTAAATRPISPTR